MTNNGDAVKTDSLTNEALREVHDGLLAVQAKLWDSFREEDWDQITEASTAIDACLKVTASHMSRTITNVEIDDGSLQRLLDQVQEAASGRAVDESVLRTVVREEIQKSRLRISVGPNALATVLILAGVAAFIAWKFFWTGLR